MTYPSYLKLVTDAVRCTRPIWSSITSVYSCLVCTTSRLSPALNICTAQERKFAIPAYHRRSRLFFCTFLLARDEARSVECPHALQLRLPTR
jgi:hypothetical protein